MSSAAPKNAKEIPNWDRHGLPPGRYYLVPVELVSTVCYVRQDLVVLLCRLIHHCVDDARTEEGRPPINDRPAGEEWESGIHLHVRKLTLSDPSDNIKYHPSPKHQKIISSRLVPCPPSAHHHPDISIIGSTILYHHCRA
jgi:hypothetical protein